jgi:hypothetical protein
MGRYTIGGQRGYFYFVSKDGKNLNAEQALALLNGETMPDFDTFNKFNELRMPMREWLQGEWVGPDNLGKPLEPVPTELNLYAYQDADLKKRLDWAKMCRACALDNGNEVAYKEADEVVRDLERQLRALTNRPAVFAGQGDKLLTPERKAQLKGTLFEHCETENEVTARHFDLMS